MTQKNKNLRQPKINFKDLLSFTAFTAISFIISTLLLNLLVSVLVDDSGGLDDLGTQIIVSLAVSAFSYIAFPFITNILLINILKIDSRKIVFIAWLPILFTVFALRHNVDNVLLANILVLFVAGSFYGLLLTVFDKK